MSVTNLCCSHSNLKSTAILNFLEFVLLLSLFMFCFLLKFKLHYLCSMGTLCKQLLTVLLFN